MVDWFDIIDICKGFHYIVVLVNDDVLVLFHYPNVVNNHMVINV
jgi:hypothetical protein